MHRLQSWPGRLQRQVVWARVSWGLGPHTHCPSPAVWPVSFHFFIYKVDLGDFPWWFSDFDSAFPMQGAQVSSLVRKLDSTFCN